MIFVCIFLALLDYVSRAHGIKIRPSSVVRRLSSVVRLWHRLSLKLLHGFLSNFGCSFPRSICPDVLFFEIFFFLIFYEYFSFSLTWDPVGAKTSKRYSSLRPRLNPFKLFLNFWMVLTKVLFWFFEILSFWSFTIFFVFINMGPYRSQNYSSLKSLLNPFKLFLNFLLIDPDKSTVLDFWNLEFLIFQDFFSFSLT